MDTEGDAGEEQQELRKQPFGLSLPSVLSDALPSAGNFKIQGDRQSDNMLSLPCCSKHPSHIVSTKFPRKPKLLGTADWDFPVHPEGRPS